MRASVATIAAGMLVACSSPQNVLNPRGPAASSIAQLWWVMFALATLVCVIVTILLLVGMMHARRRERGRRATEVSGRALVVGGGVAIPAVILFGLLVYNFRVGVAVYAPTAAADDALTIEVVGHQFWWEVRYPQSEIVTANEIRIPAGEQVRFVLHAPDVIHSFWVPQLHGKLDMIPGRRHTIYMEAGSPGMFRGQCAEYCGMGHALMAFWVEALPPEEFESWIADRRAAALEEAADTSGQEIFVRAGCAQCHGTQGRLETGTVRAGPDLAGLANRRRIAAGTLVNGREQLRRWIEDPQQIKPGSLMPPSVLDPQEMEALLDYLQSRP